MSHHKIFILHESNLSQMSKYNSVRQYQLAQYQKMKYEKEGLKTDVRNLQSNSRDPRPFRTP